MIALEVEDNIKNPENTEYEHEVRGGEKEVRQRTNKVVYNIMSSYRPGFLHFQHNLVTSLFFK